MFLTRRNQKQDSFKTGVQEFRIYGATGFLHKRSSLLRHFSVKVVGSLFQKLDKQNRKVFVYLFLAFAILSTFFFQSCGNKAIFDDVRTFQNSIWNINDTAKFSVEVNDSIQTFNFYIHFRNTTDYEYQNIYIFIETFFPDRQYIKDTMQIILADKQGKWQGKGTGKYRSNNILIRPNVCFPLKGKYDFRITQAMRDMKLKGISDIGIRVEKVK